MDKAALHKELKGLTTQQLLERLGAALEGMEEAADEVVRVSEAAQAEAAEALVASYTEEEEERERLESEMDAEDREEVLADRLEEDGKLPPGHQ